MSHSSSPIHIRRITEHDPALAQMIPILGIEQGIAHDTSLPDLPDHFPLIAENFRMALHRRHVEIWMIDSPVTGSGAVFLSPLEKQGDTGIQIDDIVVLPTHRGKGLGSALLQFTASLARSRGLSFVSWECEDNNPAQRMYRQVGATPRAHVKPFRLTRDAIMTAISTHPDALHDAGVHFTASSRFSLFRTVNYGIAGYDMDPTQSSHGVQVEDISFDDITAAERSLCAYLKHARDHEHIEFADLIIRDDNSAHMELVKRFDAAQNTYSGNPAFLWELTGDAFKKAADEGHILLAHEAGL